MASIFYEFGIGETNEKMRTVLKDSSIKFVREKGFKGSFPTFKRVVSDSHQVLNFQFNKYGGSFSVNLEIVKPSKDFYVKSLSNLEIISFRRLGTLDKHLKNKMNQDHWFKFIRGVFFKRDAYEKAAREFEICFEKDLEKTFSYMHQNET